MKIIDCHCHIYPPKIAPLAVEGIVDFYKLNKDDYDIHEGTVDDMISVENAAGISHQIVFTVATKPSQVNSINQFIADEVNKHKECLTGLGTLHPDSDTVIEDIDNLINLGLKGIKLHPDFQQFKIDDDKCFKIYEKCQNNIPILMHTGDDRFDFSNPDHVIPVLEKYPDLTIIGAHFGGWSVWHEAVEKLSKYKNFYVDCCSSMPWLTDDEIISIIRTYGADRVLFGTDYPMSEPSKDINHMLRLGLMDMEYEMIFHKNAERLFSMV